MDKKYKVTLKFVANAKAYQVVQIVGPRVAIVTHHGEKVRVGAYLSEAQTEILGEYAVLTTK